MTERLGRTASIRTCSDVCWWDGFLPCCVWWHYSTANVPYPGFGHGKQTGMGTESVINIARHTLEGLTPPSICSWFWSALAVNTPSEVCSMAVLLWVRIFTLQNPFICPLLFIVCIVSQIFIRTQCNNANSSSQRPGSKKDGVNSYFRRPQTWAWVRGKVSERQGARWIYYVLGDKCI